MTNPIAPSDLAPKRFLAHVRRNEDGSFEVHDLEAHLRAVGIRSITQVIGWIWKPVNMPLTQVNRYDPDNLANPINRSRRL